MIDARLVSGFLIVFTVLLVPFIRWLAGIAVSSAMERITGLRTDVDNLIDRQGKSERELGGVKALAGSASATAKAHEPRLSQLEIKHGRLEGRVDRAEKDIEKHDDRLDRLHTSTKVS